MKDTKRAFENGMWLFVGAMLSRILLHQEWVPMLAPISICALMSFLLSEKQ
jgi:uncharacterized membrane protein YgdD (TMEM256/DUF423 family)